MIGAVYRYQAFCPNTIIGSNIQYLICFILQSREIPFTFSAVLLKTELARHYMKIKTVNIGQTSSAAMIIFEALRQSIIEGSIKEGEFLRQDEISKLFNTSRIPVREAISRLEEQGLVKIQRYKGAFVAGLSLDDTAEIFDLRALIEPEIIRRAVPLFTDADLLKARKYCEAFGKSTDSAQWGDLNRRFHSALYEPSGLTHHIEAANNAMDRVDSYIRAQLVLSKGIKRANSEHIAILEACENRDADAACKLLKAHIVDAKQSLIENIDQGHNY